MELSNEKFRDWKITVYDEREPISYVIPGSSGVVVDTYKVVDGPHTLNKTNNILTVGRPSSRYHNSIKINDSSISRRQGVFICVLGEEMDSNKVLYLNYGKGSIVGDFYGADAQKRQTDLDEGRAVEVRNMEGLFLNGDYILGLEGILNDKK